MASFLERDWAACITVTIELRNNRGRTHRRTDRSIARVDVRVELCRNPGVGSELPIFRAHALLSRISELRPMPVSHMTFMRMEFWRGTAHTLFLVAGHDPVGVAFVSEVRIAQVFLRGGC